MAERQQRYKESEAAVFDQVKLAVKEGDSGSAIRYLYQWNDRISPGEKIATLRNLAEVDRHLSEQINGFSADMYSKNPTEGKWSRSSFLESLASIRKKIKRNRRAKERSGNCIPDLNP